MKESSSIPLNPILSSSMVNNSGSEHLLNNYSNNNNSNNSNISENIYNYSPINLNNSIFKKKQILVRSSQVITIAYQGKKLQRTEDRTILCFKRRKFPKKLSDLTGYLTTLTLFIFFSILFSICLSYAKDIKEISDSVKSSYNYVIAFMWIFAVLSIITLTDAAFASPGRQRGTPIIRSKFESGQIRKIVGGKKFFLKYCTTCNIIRDVRTFHCSKCDLCVEKHDHHCGYISNCVGAYNYKKFFIFVILAYIHVSIIFFTSAHFAFKFGGILEKEETVLLFMDVFIMLFGGFFEFFVFWMIVQHIQIIVVNRTTREFIKRKKYKVYDRGCKKNCYESLCRSYVKEM